MTIDIRFYHLQKTDLEKAIHQLLVKIHGMEKRAHVLSPSQKRIQSLDQALWTLGGEIFLPHGTPTDGRPQDHPIWLSTEPKNENQSQVLILCDQAKVDTYDKYQIYCEIFDGHNNDEVQQARQKWKEFKSQNVNLSYWQQDNSGKWNKTA